MTHGTNSEITKQVNIKNRETALRTNTTGLNYPLNQLLFTLTTTDLPNALTKAQELHSNEMRAQFALQFKKKNEFHSRNHPQANRRISNFQNNLRYPQRTTNQY